MQLGIDPPAVRLDGLGRVDEHLIAALASGVSRHALGMVACAAGGTSADAEDLLRRLGRGVVGPSSAPARETSVLVAGVGATSGWIVDALVSTGTRVEAIGDDPERAAAPADIAVVVAHYVIPPALYGGWLRRDRPHLPVVFSDQAVRVGPMVEPGLGPCLHCLERFRTDADPAWPAIASQLWGRRSPLDAGLLAGEAAAVAARLVLQRLTGGAATRHSSVGIDARTGVRTTSPQVPHPECGCGALPENGTASAAPIGSAPSATRTARAVSALG